MEDFYSKHSGQGIENLLDQISNGGTGGGGITSETDPIFSASPAASITEEKKAEWDNKVDKVEGKQLSTEDFTTTLKNKLNSLNNYDDTEINEVVNTLREDFDTLVSGDTSTAIKSFNDIIAFLNGIEDSESLDSIIASIQQQIAGKMDNVTLAAVAISGDYDDLNNKPIIPSAVTESTVSGWGFTKNAGTITEVTVNEESVGNSGKVNIPKASTSRYGVVKLTNETGSTSTSYAATANAVKKAYDLADSKQDKVVSAGGTAKIDWNNDIDNVPGIMDSGDNIDFNKPISIADGFFFDSDNSALGGRLTFGNAGIHYEILGIAIGDLPATMDIIHTGDGTKFLSDDGTYKAVGGGSGGGKEYVKVTLSEGGLVFMDYAESDNFPLEPNKVYYVDSFVSEGVSIQDVVPPTGDVGEYTVHFVCNGSPVFMDTFECPANWQWANGQKPTLENGTAYELSVVATKVNGIYFYKAVLTAFNRV